MPDIETLISQHSSETNINPREFRTTCLLLKIQNWNMSASKLPVEIWLQILEQFCVHCHSTEILDFRLPEYKQGQSVLLALSLTARAMRDLSQPLLYHCFYTDPDQPKTSRFLRTMISRPQMASHVRILSLHESNRCDQDSITRRDFEAWTLLSARFSIFVPSEVRDALLGNTWSPLQFDEEGQDAHLRARSSNWTREQHVVKLHSWQNLLILYLCSGSITCLETSALFGLSGIRPPTLNSSATSSDRLVQSAPDFQNLRVFSCKHAYACEHFSWFFTHAPLLRRVAVGRVHPHPIETSLFGLSPTASPIPSVSVTNTRKLSTAIHPAWVEYMLHFNPEVRDLELHLLRGYWISNGPQLDPWPASVKAQLRRLCFSNSRSWERRANDDTIMVPPLTEFESLEILEIDRTSLYIALDKRLAPNTSQKEAARLLPTILPASLRILHTSFGLDQFDSGPRSSSWTTIMVELEALALAKITFLRKLSVVQIDHPRRSTPGAWTMGETFEMMGVVRDMRNAGIELRFGLDPRSEFGSQPHRGMVPPLPGSWEPPGNLFTSFDDPVEVEVFDLED